MKPSEMLPPDANIHELTLARGLAIKEYVALETALAHWYQFARRDMAAIKQFYDMSNFDRLRALRVIVFDGCPAQYQVYGHSLIDDLESLVDMRNFIAHSHQLMGAEEVVFGGDYGPHSRRYRACLVPPDWAGRFAKIKRMATQDVTAAAQRFAYCSSCVGAFVHALVSGRAATERLEVMFGSSHQPIPKRDHPMAWAYYFEHLKPTAELGKPQDN